MNEEFVTKAILKALADAGWEIVSFDFPQSGTGRTLHPDDIISKNEGAIVPDVVAVKDGVCLYLENKDHYSYSDFVKVRDVIQGKRYEKAFRHMLEGVDVKRMVCGIGMPVSSFVGEAVANSSMVGVVLCVSDRGEVSVASPSGEFKL